MTKNKSEIANMEAEIVQKLRATIIDLGGSDDDWYRLRFNESLVQKVAMLLIGETNSVRTLIDMTVAGKCDWVSGNITEKKFPVDPFRFMSEGQKVFCFGRTMTTVEVGAEMQEEGYEPEGIEGLLAHGAENSKEQRERPIIALDACRPLSGGCCDVPFLRDDGRWRYLDLLWDDPGYRWSGTYRFLGRKSST